jgi:riboflavin kinase/FMN adenylyltransferase
MPKRIFALGFFDGVHLGHQALLKCCRELAGQLNMGTAAITFENHPQSLFTKEAPPLLSTAADRRDLLREYGMDHIFEFPVTKDVMGKPWDVFLEELLDFGAAGFVCGYDFRFGHRGQGNAEKLAQYCAERGMPCVVLPEQDLDHIRISSTYIRRQLETGDMATAVRFLGHPYILTGKVVKGHQLGRKLGFPTANLRLPENLVIPRFGVYACVARVDGKRYPAVTNVGTRPTVSGIGITVEPWILDYSGDLYGQEITLEFYRFLRPEQKFDSLEDLQREIFRNADQTREILKEVSKKPPCAER